MFWKQYNLLDAIKFVIIAWSEVSSASIVSSFSKLIIGNRETRPAEHSCDKEEVRLEEYNGLREQMLEIGQILDWLKIKQMIEIS